MSVSISSHVSFRLDSISDQHPEEAIIGELSPLGYLTSKAEKRSLEIDFVRENYYSSDRDGECSFLMNLKVILETRHSVNLSKFPKRFFKKWNKDGFLDIEGHRFTTDLVTQTTEIPWKKKWTDFDLRRILPESYSRNLNGIIMGEITGRTARTMVVEIVKVIFYKREKEIVKKFFPRHFADLEKWDNVASFRKGRIYYFKFEDVGKQKVLLEDCNYIPMKGNLLSDGSRVDICPENFVLNKKGCPIEVHEFDYPEFLASHLTSTIEKERNLGLEIKEKLEKLKQQQEIRLQNAYKLVDILEKKYKKGKYATK